MDLVFSLEAKHHLYYRQFGKPPFDVKSAEINVKDVLKVMQLELCEQNKAEIHRDLNFICKAVPIADVTDQGIRDLHFKLKRGLISFGANVTALRMAITGYDALIGMLSR